MGPLANVWYAVLSMQDQHYTSEDADKWTWIILAGILVLAVIVGFISLGIMSNNQAMQSQSPAQTAPAK